jgi:hypothetical protein
MILSAAPTSLINMLHVTWNANSIGVQDWRSGAGDTIIEADVFDPPLQVGVEYTVEVEIIPELDMVILYSPSGKVLRGTHANVSEYCTPYCAFETSENATPSREVTFKKTWALGKANAASNAACLGASMARPHELIAATTTTKGVVALATATETTALLDTTRAITPSAMLDLIANTHDINLSPAGWGATGTSGTGARVTTLNIIDLYTGATTNSVSMVKSHSGGTNAIMVSPGDIYYRILWSKPKVFIVDFALQLATATSEVWINIGDVQNDATVGNLANMGVAINIANATVNIGRHDGTTYAETELGTITSGANPFLNRVIITLDGAGNFSAALNGGAAVTGTGCPTVGGPANCNGITAAVINGATAASVRLMIPQIKFISA